MKTILFGDGSVGISIYATVGAVGLLFVPGLGKHEIGSHIQDVSARAGLENPDAVMLEFQDVRSIRVLQDQLACIIAGIDGHGETIAMITKAVSGVPE